MCLLCRDRRPSEIYEVFELPTGAPGYRRRIGAITASTGRSETSKAARFAENAFASGGSSRASAASMAEATRGTRGTSYQKCGFTSGPYEPSTTWTDSATLPALTVARAAGT